MAPILRRLLQKCEQQTSDTGVSEVNLLRYAEMNTCVHTTSTQHAGTRSIGSGGCGTQRLCTSAWANSATSGHATGSANLGNALSGQAQARPSSAISKEAMTPQELLRNANTRSAWEVPTQSIAQKLQRDLQGQHAPAKASYFHITKPEDAHRSQRIARAAI